MTVKLKELPIRLLNSVFDILSDEKIVQVVFNIISHRAKSRPATEALKFLFKLDTMLYHLQGRISIVYDRGIHPKHRLMNYHDFFIQRITENDRVLDIGCGIGAVAYDVAKDTGAQVLGIDINADNIRTAKERYQHPRLEFRMGDALKTLPNEKYSLVMLSNVLEHLPGRPAFLRRVQEVAQPSRFLIRVPLFERDWRVPLKKEVGVEWRLDDTHEIEYTLETFASEMQEAGLTVKHLEVRWGEIWAELFPSE
ncbi:MAG: class I SAM-dependent methyltransferase [Anaerolineales bacterium]|nr:class I SAM-dependent methyltransferase [Anaerolineales bacterium]